MSDFDKLKDEAEKEAQQHPQQVKEGEQAVEKELGGQQGQQHQGSAGGGDQGQGSGGQTQQGSGAQSQQGSGGQSQ